MLGEGGPFGVLFIYHHSLVGSESAMKNLPHRPRCLVGTALYFTAVTIFLSRWPYYGTLVRGKEGFLSLKKITREISRSSDPLAKATSSMGKRDISTFVTSGCLKVTR